MKISTCSIGTQREPEVVTTVTQTTMDSASQTEPLPEERASQTSTDVEIHTAKVDDYFSADDRFVVGAVQDITALLLRYANQRIRSDQDYARLHSVFQKAYEISMKKDYWQEDGDDEDDADSNQDEGSRPVTRQREAKSK